MYSFEGQFRSRPVQSFGGASKKEQRSNLLERAQDERQKREDLRRRISSAVIIQSAYRGFKVRFLLKEADRRDFDCTWQNIQRSCASVEDSLSPLWRQLLAFYEDRVDGPRLTWFCQLCVRHQTLIAKHVCGARSLGVLRIKRLLWICCRHLRAIAATSSPLALPMRMLEIYTNPAVYKTVTSEQHADAIIAQTIGFLIGRGYYQCMRVLIEGKIPPNLERTVTPPTPLAGSILDLVKKPLNLMNNSKDVTLRYEVLRSLSTHLFCPDFTEQIKEFILPALVESSECFPFVDLLQSLVGTEVGARSVHPSQSPLSVPASLPLLYAVLHFSEKYIERLSDAEVKLYLRMLLLLAPDLRPPGARHEVVEDDSDSEDDPDDMDVDYMTSGVNKSHLLQNCIHLLDRPANVKAIVTSVTQHPDCESILAVCSLCHVLMAQNKMAIHKTRLLYSLAFNPQFLRQLWLTCMSLGVRTVTGSETPLLQMLSRGLSMSPSEQARIVPLLSVFCSLFSHSLLSLHDSEFYGDRSGSKLTMPFRTPELVPIALALRDACLGVIELAHPDTRPALMEEYQRAFRSVGVVQHDLSDQQLMRQRHTLAYLFKVLIQLVKQLYSRDSRRRFCPPDHWLARQVSIHADKPSQLYKASSGLFVRRPFGTLSALNPKRMLDEEGPPMSTMEVRNLTILTEMPFVVSFEERVKIFQKLIQQDRVEHQGSMRHLAGGPRINIMVRRNYLYEDAFDKLSVDNEPNLKLHMQVQLKNFAGLDEAGIDGGGLFREFMSELLKTGFEPNRGFFKYTQDQLLYPNPGARLLVPDFTKHYYFVGRMLGKAIFENMLVELPFASFFLNKILSRHRGDVDIHHLASLDPEMYRNLLFLKDYDGDVSDLGLDFTVVNNDLGEAHIEELKVGGKDMPVSNHNRIEYIHLMADYRLNKQIRIHCQAFRQGLADVINIEWLRMFDHNELQVLISGAPVPIDIDDLRLNTNYSGGYNVDHPVIRTFWKTVEEFTDTQKRQLLKFVTSCSRPPLLGFKELYPAFCIQNGGREERLPTASTCMNLLKLPEFQEEDALRQKLTYAIESGAGFELS